MWKQEMTADNRGTGKSEGDATLILDPQHKPLPPTLTLIRSNGRNGNPLSDMHDSAEPLQKDFYYWLGRASSTLLGMKKL